MRGHEKYLEKVYDELDVYRKHLHHGDDLPERFADSWDKIEVARAWVRSGYSDSEVLQLLKNDPATRLQARRAREVLALAYEIFADIRIARNADGIKQKYADELNDAARDVKDDIQHLRDIDGDSKDIAALMKVWKDLKAEAAKIDGAYLPTAKGSGDFKKPTKVVFKRKTIIQNGTGNVQKVISDNLIEEAHYEIQE